MAALTDNKRQSAAFIFGVEGSKNNQSVKNEKPAKLSKLWKWNI